jgi:hypothetical protein
MRSRTKQLVAVRVMWGDDVLCFRLLRPGQRFAVGPDPGAADFIVPAERHSVRLDRRGNVILETPEGHRLVPMPAKLEAPLGDSLQLCVRSARERSLLRSFAARSWLLDLALVAGVTSYALMVVLVTFLTFDASLQTEGETIERDARVTETSGSWSLGGSGTSFALSPDWRPMLRVETSTEPRPGFAIFPEQTARERARERGLLGKRVDRERADDRLGGTGARAPLAAGPLGNPEEPEALGSWSLTRIANVKPVPADRARFEADKAPALCTLVPREYSAALHIGWDDESSDQGIDAPFGEEEAVGEDDADVIGNTFGPEPVDPAGKALAVDGAGPGGGGKRQSVGLGKHGKLGHGAGSARDQGVGVADVSHFTRDVGLGAHRPRAPRFSTVVAPATVERVLLQSAGRFQSCGHISGASFASVSFAIDATGATRAIGVQSEPGLSPEATACLRKIVAELSFLPTKSGSAPITRRVRLR